MLMGRCIGPSGHSGGLATAPRNESGLRDRRRWADRQPPAPDNFRHPGTAREFLARVTPLAASRRNAGDLSGGPHGPEVRAQRCPGPRWPASRLRRHKRSATAKLGPRGSRGRGRTVPRAHGDPPQVLDQMKARPYWAYMQSFARTLLASRWRHCDAASGVSGSPAASLPFHARPRGDLRRDMFCPLS